MLKQVIGLIGTVVNMANELLTVIWHQIYIEIDILNRVGVISAIKRPSINPKIPAIASMRFFHVQIWE